MAKKLTLAKMNEFNKQVEESVEVLFPISGENYAVNLKPYIDYKTIADSLEELKDLIVNGKKYDLGFVDADFISLFFFLIIKNRSDLDVPVRDDYKTEKGYYQAVRKFYEVFFSCGFLSELSDRIPEGEKVKAVKAFNEYLMLKTLSLDLFEQSLNEVKENPKLKMVEDAKAKKAKQQANG